LRKAWLPFFLLLFVTCGNLYCEENYPSISIVFECFGATAVDGLNIEYSPNKNIDVGFGYMGSKFPIPLEIHAYARYDLFRTIITPYFEISSLAMLWEPNSGERILARLHFGIIGRLENGFLLGISCGYQIVGSDSLNFTGFGKIVPGAFIGWKLKIKQEK